MKNHKQRLQMIVGGKQMIRKVSVFDVAKYIIEKTGTITTMKLQKLVYYSQAWSLVWDGEPLFPDDFQAWANGPVCPALFNSHRGSFIIGASKLSKGDSSLLNKDQKETIEGVLQVYGDKDGHWLSLLTHKERPWRDARKDVSDGEYCTDIITKESMQDYYAGI